MPGKTFSASKPYLSIIQGNFRQTVEETSQGAIRRDYELKDGTKGTKFELSFIEWSGKIIDLRMKDTKYGETLEIEMNDAIITINVESRYFDDIMMKLPAVNLAQTLSIHPYDFEVDGKRKKGISLEQNGEKIKSYYWNDKDGTSCNGLPQPKADAKKTYKKSDWTLYFLTRTNFLKATLDGIKETLESIVPEISTVAPLNEVDTSAVRDDEIVEMTEDKSKKKKELVVDEPFDLGQPPF